MFDIGKLGRSRALDLELGASRASARPTRLKGADRKNGVSARRHLRSRTLSHGIRPRLTGLVGSGSSRLQVLVGMTVTAVSHSMLSLDSKPTFANLLSAFQISIRARSLMMDMHICCALTVHVKNTFYNGLFLAYLFQLA